MGRFTASLGIDASSPTPGKPVVSIRGGFGSRGASGRAGGGVFTVDCVKVMPDDAL
jgi:hypothetical protein